jgi:bifunctional non-homologous end joining protein LigD
MADDRAKKRRGAASAGEYVPQLATLAAAAPEGDGWLHEAKFDGYRIGAIRSGRDVRLVSRNGHDWTERFAEVAAAVGALAARSALVDGEVAAVLADGRTSFQALQNSFGPGKRASLAYFVFDLLELDGDDLRVHPLEERKEALRDLVDRSRSSIVRFSEHVVGGGSRVHAEACRLGLEGIVSKLRGAPHRAGRTRDWLKTKCMRRQELVIGGFTDPQGGREGLGALLVGVHDAAGRLAFAGKVGTGFSQSSARDLRRRLEGISRPTSPFETAPPGWLGRNAHWVEPRLVAEVAFTEWTSDGKVRHPSFQGLREDKHPREVVREIEAPPAAPSTPPRRRPTPTARAAAAPAVAGVRLTHAERVLYPDAGLTKLDLARFYESIAEWIVPHLAGRPLTLVRCPEGVAGACFYMKHSKVWAPPALRRVEIAEKTKIGDYLIADDLAAVVSLVQMGVLEIHTWNSTADRLERPDRIVFDLDPGPSVAWPRVVEAARLVRAALGALGLRSFVKTTGGAGLHVVVPIVPERDWSECFAFSRALAERLVAERRRELTTAMPKRGRERKILIDFFRNNRTNTSVAAYSTRAKPRPTVSTPIAWDELSPRLRSDHYDVETVRRRLARLRADPWADAARPQRLRPEILDALDVRRTRSGERAVRVPD